MSSKLHLVAFMGLIVMSSSFVLDEKNYDESTAGKQVVFAKMLCLFESKAHIGQRTGKDISDLKICVHS